MWAPVYNKDVENYNLISEVFSVVSNEHDDKNKKDNYKNENK